MPATGLKVALFITMCLLAASGIKAQDTKAGQDSAKAAADRPVDNTLKERMEHLGLIVPEDVKKRFEELDKLPAPVLLNPQEHFDWRDMGGVTPVKDQANCGSCWDFAATGAFECAIIINTQIEMDLSEQQVLSCNTGGSSCAGGWMEDAYSLFMSYGAIEEACMPYEADDNVPCTQDECIPMAWMTSYEDIPNNINSIKNAVTIAPVSTTFMVYSDFQWDCYWHEDTGDINHAVVIVGWDDNMCGGQGAWIVKNSWSAYWGDGGYFYMQYGSCGIGRYTQRPIYGNLRYLTFSYPNGFPVYIDPAGGSTVRVEIEGSAGNPRPGTGTFYYNIGSGWESQAMAIVSPNVYDAIFPASDCGNAVPYYFSAETDEGHLVNDPIDAPSSNFMTISANSLTPIFEDDFETDLGWTVGGDAVDGQWERGVPAGGGDRGDPPADYDGSGRCYITDNADGNSDVDDGYTFLVSPAFDLDGLEAVVNYALWYTNNYGDDPNNDLFKVYVSNDNGAGWILAETVGPVTLAGWTEHSFILGDFVIPTNQVKVRFEASDLAGGSVVEAGIDAFSINVIDCDTVEDIPTISEWGLLMMGLVLLGMGTVAIVRRRKTAVDKAA